MAFTDRSLSGNYTYPDEDQSFNAETSGHTDDTYQWGCTQRLDSGGPSPPLSSRAIAVALDNQPRGYVQSSSRTMPPPPLPGLSSRGIPPQTARMHSQRSTASPTIHNKEQACIQQPISAVLPQSYGLHSRTTTLQTPKMYMQHRTPTPLMDDGSLYSPIELTYSSESANTSQQRSSMPPPPRSSSRSTTPQFGVYPPCGTLPAALEARRQTYVQRCLAPDAKEQAYKRKLQVTMAGYMAKNIGMSLKTNPPATSASLNRQPEPHGPTDAARSMYGSSSQPINLTGSDNFPVRKSQTPTTMRPPIPSPHMPRSQQLAMQSGKLAAMRTTTRESSTQPTPRGNSPTVPAPTTESQTPKLTIHSPHRTSAFKAPDLHSGNPTALTPIPESPEQHLPLTNTNPARTKKPKRNSSSISKPARTSENPRPGLIPQFNHLLQQAAGTSRKRPADAHPEAQGPKRGAFPTGVPVVGAGVAPRGHYAGGITLGHTANTGTASSLGLTMQDFENTRVRELLDGYGVRGRMQDAVNAANATTARIGFGGGGGGVGPAAIESEEPGVEAFWKGVEEPDNEVSWSEEKAQLEWEISRITPGYWDRWER